MNKTKIEWADYTWNPVTGCLHGCQYCYARKIAERFCPKFAPMLGDPGMEGAAKYDGPLGMDTMLELAQPYRNAAGVLQPYPIGFDPTLHRYKLDEPARKTKGVTIFVCSMADLFGEWVPDAWVQDVFDHCAAAPQHTYLFLTKNPKRYNALAEAGKLPQAPNMWYGTSTPTESTEFFFSDAHNTFVSIEPILTPFKGWYKKDPRVGWVIFGAETGNRKERARPKWSWISDMVPYLKTYDIPVFMKDSLKGIVPEGQLRRETPEGISLGKERA